jgi:TatD DNase family protein
MPPEPASLPPLVDTHCHLTWDVFQEEMDAVLGRMAAEGVEQAVVVATSVADGRQAAALCAGRPMLHPTCGLHPNDLPEDLDAALRDLDEAVGGGGFVAIGETGLDYYRDAVPPEAQRRSFLHHAHLARTNDLPLIVHVRDREGRTEAFDDVAIVLAEAEGVRGVIHCYTGDEGHARRYLDQGFYVSFAGILTFPRGENVRRAAKAVPIERALVETDAPFLAPVPHRGARNEPAFVAHTARALAEVKGLSEADVRRITTHNARDLFRLPGERGPGPATYAIRDALYVNLTNACDSRCTFCPRTDDDYRVKGHDLRRARDPRAEEIVAEIKDPGRWREIVFCGFGEPTLRLETLKAVARWVKDRGGRTRLNTNGHADAIHRRTAERSTALELRGLVDTVSVSLNAQDRETFERHCPSAFSPDGFTPMLDYVRRCVAAGLDVVLTAVDGLPGVDMEACERLALSLGGRWRGRVLDEVG